MCYYFRSRTLPWAPAPWPPCLFSSRDGNHRWRWVEITCKFILPPSIFIFSRHLKYHFSAILSFKIFPPFSILKFSRHFQFRNFPAISNFKIFPPKIALFLIVCVVKEEDAKQLVRDAIASGIFNDMGSGSNVDLVVIKANDHVSRINNTDS